MKGKKKKTRLFCPKYLWKSCCRAPQEKIKEDYAEVKGIRMRMKEKKTLRNYQRLKRKSN